MNREYLSMVAKSTGFIPEDTDISDSAFLVGVNYQSLLRFAKKLVENEREECAKLCEGQRFTSLGQAKSYSSDELIQSNKEVTKTLARFIRDRKIRGV